ncbi:hypothetical protein M153_5600005587, partial [Pseudoloma neurophilia]
LRHCSNPKYSYNTLILFFNLEIFLLAQIAEPPESFYNAYENIKILPIVLECIKQGNIHKIDNMMHINREEEIESLTYKYYKVTYQGYNLQTDQIQTHSDHNTSQSKSTESETPLSKDTFCNNTGKNTFDKGTFVNDIVLPDPSTLVSLLLYQRNEPHRFFKIYYNNRNVITHRIAVLFAIHHKSIIHDNKIFIDDNTYIWIKQLYDDTYIQGLTYIDISEFYQSDSFHNNVEVSYNNDTDVNDTNVVVSPHNNDTGVEVQPPCHNNTDVVVSPHNNDTGVEVSSQNVEASPQNVEASPQNVEASPHNVEVSSHNNDIDVVVQPQSQPPCHNNDTVSGTPVLYLLYLPDQIRNMPMGFFSKLRKKFSLDRITKENHEITYNTVLTHFNNITIKKSKIRNCIEFKKWYKREKRDKQWKDLVTIWIDHCRDVDGRRNVAVDLSMMDICTEYGEYEKGHFIYNNLINTSHSKTQTINNGSSKKSKSGLNNIDDMLTKYTHLCITALKSNNPEQVRQVNMCKKKEPLHTLLSDKTVLSDKTIDKTVLNNDKTVLSNKTVLNDVLPCCHPCGCDRTTVTSNQNTTVTSNCCDKMYNTECKKLLLDTTFDYKSNSCLIVHNDGCQNNTGDTSQNNDTTQQNNNTGDTSQYNTGDVNSVDEYDTLWTDRLITNVLSNTRSENTTTVLFTMLVSNILYFKTDTRDTIKKYLYNLSNEELSDKSIKTVLSVLYNIVIDYNTYICKNINNLLYGLSNRLYKKFKNNQSFFRRGDKTINESIYSCMLGVCHETHCKSGFLLVCNDLKSSSTSLNKSMIKIIENYHSSDCNCEIFRTGQSKKNVIKHILSLSERVE